MPITSDNPVVVPPAATTVVFDTWWVNALRISTVEVTDGITSTTSVPATVIYRLGRMDGSTFVAYLDDNGEYTDKGFTIPDIFALAQTNQDVANAISNLVTLLGTLGKSNGVIS